MVRKPKKHTAKDKMRANVAKNCLIVTLTSLEPGYGAILERHKRVQLGTSELNSIALTEEEVLTHVDDPIESSNQRAATAAMPPPAVLAKKDANIKMYHVTSVKQTVATLSRITLSLDGGSY